MQPVKCNMDKVMAGA